MSQTHRSVYVVHQSNSAGTAGMVLSIVGLLTCGVLCPMGFFLSCIGLLREPRGGAIAGAIIGGLGSTPWILLAMGVIALPFQEVANQRNRAAANADLVTQDAIAAPKEAPMIEPPPTIEQPQQEPPSAIEAHTPADVSPPNDAPLVPREDLRTWTDATGQHEVAAFFDGFSNGTVVLRRLNGEIVKLPLERLSAADQAWVNEKRQANKR